MPMSRRLAGVSVMSRSPTRTRPESSRSRPASERSAVVLPQPEGPSSATSSPGRQIERQAIERAAPRRTGGAARPAARGRRRAAGLRGAGHGRGRARKRRLQGHSSATRTRARAALVDERQEEQQPRGQQQGGQRDRDRDAGIALAEQVDHHLQGVEVEERGDRELAEHERHRDQRRGHDRTHDVGHDDPPDHAEPRAAEAAAGLGERDAGRAPRDRRRAPGRRTAARGSCRRRSACSGIRRAGPQTQR